MYRFLFSCLLGLSVGAMSFLPLTVNSEVISQQYYGLYNYPSASVYYNSSSGYGYPTGSYYGTYYYPSYSNYSVYPNPYATSYRNPYSYYVNPYYGYANPYYGSYYYNPGMYNPNTTFVNPPSSLNYPTGYPGYSETYIYR